MPKKTKSIKVTDSRGQKPWLKKQQPSAYKVEVREKRKTFLIVCEGQTEELYFSSFPVLTASVKAVPLGCTKLTLVECAKSLAENDEYDEIWCVFDMDHQPDAKGQRQEFDNAIKRAIAEGYKCAYSNDAFELWFVLHYQYIDQEYLRNYFYETLSNHWSINYEKTAKTRSFARSIYDYLQKDGNADQARAILNARKLYETHKGKVYHQQNPVTTVFQLVEELNLHLRG
jgi:hypothetical protein